MDIYSIISNNFSFKPWFQNSKSFISTMYRNIFLFSDRYLPKPLRKIMISFVITITDAFNRLLQIGRFFLLETYCIQGIEKFSKKKIRIFFLGNPKNPDSIYFLHILFKDNPKIEYLGSVSIFKLKNKILLCEKCYNAILFEGDMLFSNYLRRMDFLVIPQWVSCCKNLCGKNMGFSRSIKRKIKEIQEKNYSYEIVTDSEKLDLFYNDMYLPYVKDKFNGEAIYYSDYMIKYFFEDGHNLMLIKYKNEYVGGSFFQVRKNQIIGVITGIKKNKYYLLKEGLGSALYYYIIKWGTKNDIKYFYMGGSRAFLDDGVIQFKRKWNISLSRYDRRFGVFGLKIIKEKTEYKQFLVNNPFVSLNYDGLSPLIFVNKEKYKSNRYNIPKEYLFQGTSKPRIIKL